MRGIKTWMVSNTTEQDTEERFNLKLVLDKLVSGPVEDGCWNLDMDGLKHNRTRRGREIQLVLGA